MANRVTYPTGPDWDRVEIRKPSEIIAGTFSEFEIAITITGPDVTEGDRIALAMPGGFTIPQFDDPTGEGYTTAKTEGRADLSLSHLDRYERIILVTVTSGMLQNGDEILLTYGDRSNGGPGSQARMMAHKDILLAYFRLEDGEKKLHPASPRISVTADRATNLRGYLTPALSTGEEGKLTIVAEDAWGNCAPDFEGELEIENSSALEGIPPKVHFSRSDQGKKSFSFRGGSPGIFRLVLRSPSLGLTALTTPTKIRENGNGMRLYFGDIHVHSELSSDGSGAVDELYLYARDTAILDFAACSDHTLGASGLSGVSTHPATLPLDDYASMPDRWALACQASKKFNAPGNFVTFPAFEASSLGIPGHRNLYYLEECPPPMKIDPAEGTPELAWSKDRINPSLEGREVLVIPHHPAIMFRPGVVEGGGLVYEDVDRSRQPVIEIYSKHGTSEYYGNPRPLCGQRKGHFIRDMLEAGGRFGFIGGSDTHMANAGCSATSYPGHFTTLQYRGGLAAVWAKELTREAIWEAIFARRCYATTYPRIILSFKVSDLFMGEEGKHPYPRQIYLEVAGQDRIHKVEIIRNSETIHAESPHQPRYDWSINIEDDQPSDREVDYYYARVTQHNGEIAWSSPVWVG